MQVAALKMDTYELSSVQKHKIYIFSIFSTMEYPIKSKFSRDIPIPNMHVFGKNEVNHFRLNQDA